MRWSDCLFSPFRFFFAVAYTGLNELLELMYTRKEFLVSFHCFTSIDRRENDFNRFRFEHYSRCICIYLLWIFNAFDQAADENNSKVRYKMVDGGRTSTDNDVKKPNQKHTKIDFAQIDLIGWIDPCSNVIICLIILFYFTSEKIGYQLRTHRQRKY